MILTIQFSRFVTRSQKKRFAKIPQAFETVKSSFKETFSSLCAPLAGQLSADWVGLFLGKLTLIDRTKNCKQQKHRLPGDFKNQRINLGENDRASAATLM